MIHEAIAAPSGSSDNVAPDDAVELSIVMPCLNEAETVEACVRAAAGWLSSAGVRGEVVVADNGSTDGSIALAQRAGARVVPVASKGYGNALMGGIVAARGRFVIMGDSDGNHDLAHLDPFLEKLREGYQFVIGNRYRGGIAPGSMSWLNKHVGNPLLSSIGRLFFPCPVGDFFCGLRGFDRDAILSLDLRTTGMEFSSEMVVKSVMNHLRVTEVPTRQLVSGRSRAPHLHPIKDGWRVLRFLLLYSPRWLFLQPGIVLMALGVVFGALSWQDARAMFVAALMVIVGFQAVLFAAFTRIFATSVHLMPADPNWERLYGTFTLERGVVAGAIAIVLGGVVVVVALASQSPDLSRLIIPAGTSLALGAQLLLASFFMSILGLRRR